MGYDSLLQAEHLLFLVLVVVHLGTLSQPLIPRLQARHTITLEGMVAPYSLHSTLILNRLYKKQVPCGSVSIEHYCTEREIVSM